MKNAKPAHNRSVCASPPYGGSGYAKYQSGFALCDILLRHIFAVAGTLRVPATAKISYTAGTLYVIYPIDLFYKNIDNIMKV
jgi:hypothetical protein